MEAESTGYVGTYEIAISAGQGTSHQRLFLVIQFTIPGQRLSGTSYLLL